MMTSLAWVTFDILQELQGQDHSRAPQVGRGGGRARPESCSADECKASQELCKIRNPQCHNRKIKPNLSSILNEAAYAIIFRAAPVQANEGPDSWRPRHARFSWENFGAGPPRRH